MQDNDSLDEMRKRIQESLIQTKREQLRDEFGMQFDHMDERLPPEVQNEWLDYILDFERQFENAPRITVRERIGNPAIQPMAEIPLYALEEAVNDLLDLLAEHGIAVDFMGEWDDLAAYRFITEELLDEEMDDIRIEGMFSHFEATTPEYDVQMWVDDEGTVTAVITWQPGNEQKQVESFFRLQPSPYFGLDVVQTSLLDDLLAVLS